MEKITTKEIKEEYELEDKDYLLIRAIQDLTKAINILRARMK